MENYKYTDKLSPLEAGPVTTPVSQDYDEGELRAYTSTAFLIDLLLGDEGDGREALLLLKAYIVEGRVEREIRRRQGR